jgi:hypothetical protein
MRLKHRGSIMLAAGLALGLAGGAAVGLKGGDGSEDADRLARLEDRLAEAEAALTTWPEHALEPVEAVRGWRVAVFDAPAPHDGGRWAEAGRDAGRFVHTAPWIELAEHRQHDGIFLPGSAGLHLTGRAFAPATGPYELALHMEVAALPDAAASARRLVSCYVTVIVDGHHRVLDGDLDVTAGPAPARGSLNGQPVSLAGRVWHEIDARVSCALPDGLDGSDVMLRLCWRAPGESGFRPIDARIPVVEDGPQGLLVNYRGRT